MSIHKFRKKPVEVEAVEWTGSNVTDICDFVAGFKTMPGTNVVKDGPSRKVFFDLAECVCKIETLEGTMTASAGDWIIRGVAGEFYPCKPDIFWQTY